MSIRIRTAAHFILGVGLMIALLYVAFRDADFPILINELRNVNLIWIIMAIPFLMLSHYIRAWRWQLLLIPVKDRIKRVNAFSSLMMGYTVNNILPRGGEIVRPYTLGQIENISKVASLGSVFLERTIDLLSLLLGLGVILLMYSSTIYDHFPWWRSVNIIVFGSVIILVTMILTMIYRRDIPARMLAFLLSPFPEIIRTKGETFYQLFADGLLFVRERNNLHVIVILSIGMWLSYIFMAYFPLYAFDIEAGSVNIMTGFVLTIVTALSVLVPTPGAAGAFHTFTAETLIRYYGVQKEIALSYATLTHAAGYFSVIALGVYYFIRYNIKVREILHEENIKESEYRLDLKNKTPDNR